jgi:hypothetical protein
MEVDRRIFLATLGSAAAIQGMPDEAKAEALEHYMTGKLDEQATGNELVIRRGAGSLFGAPGPSGNKLTPLATLEKMPEKPTLIDFFKLRFAPATHVLQSATDAMRKGEKEEVVLACLMHDVVLNLIKVDHGWWGAQMFEPYVPEKTSFGIRYHQALRFYADEAAGYEYPDLYRRTFGSDYTPEPYIEATYKMVRNHKWYMEPRLVTVNDLYAFDPKAVVTIDPFTDIVGRHFKQPKEGLGFDNSAVAHMWRSIAFPDHPL